METVKSYDEAVESVIETIRKCEEEFRRNSNIGVYMLVISFNKKKEKLEIIDFIVGYQSNEDVLMAMVQSAVPRLFNAGKISLETAIVASRYALKEALESESKKE